MTPRSCSGGGAPSNLVNSVPPATTTTVGIACTRSACATCGAVSTFTVANDHLPPSASARALRSWASRTLASLRGDHSSTKTGASFDRTSTSASKLASVISTPLGGAAPSPAGADRCLRADRSTAPAMEAAMGGRGRLTPPSLSRRFRCAPPWLGGGRDGLRRPDTTRPIGPYEEDHTGQRHNARQQRQQPCASRPVVRDSDQ